MCEPELDYTNRVVFFRDLASGVVYRYVILNENVLDFYRDLAVMCPTAQTVANMIAASMRPLCTRVDVKQTMVAMRFSGILERLDVNFY